MIGFRTDSGSEYHVSESRKIISGGALGSPRKYIWMKCIEGLCAEVELAPTTPGGRVEVLRTTPVEKILTVFNC